MLDLKFLRENQELVKENIKKKFQDHKLPLVDQVVELDLESRKTQQEADNLRANRKKISKQIGALMAQGKKEEAEQLKDQVNKDADTLAQLEEKEKELQEKVKEIMMVIPNIIDPSVPIGKDDSENVELERFGDPVVPDFEITLTEKSLPSQRATASASAAEESVLPAKIICGFSSKFRFWDLQNSIAALAPR